MARIIFAILDVAKDGFNAYGYLEKMVKIRKNLDIDNVNDTVTWELGLTWFLFIYTVGGMFIPAFAYWKTFQHLLKDMKDSDGKDKWIYWFYTCMAAPLSPVITIIRSVI